MRISAVCIKVTQFITQNVIPGLSIRCLLLRIVICIISIVETTCSNLLLQAITNCFEGCILNHHFICHWKDLIHYVPHKNSANEHAQGKRNTAITVVTTNIIFVSDKRSFQDNPNCFWMYMYFDFEIFSVSPA